MGTFNLIDEPWIPCLVDGVAGDVGLREVLTHAHDISEVTDVSPLTTIALYRLLLTILHRVHGPKWERDWNRMWGAGQWEVDPVLAYLEQCRPRLDLVDPERPFFQDPGIEAEWSPIQRLSHELGPANADMFVDVPEGTPIGAGEAARYLLAYQLFSPGGLVGLQKHEDKENRKRFKSARAAPLAGSAVCLATGRNLAETLLLNMVPYDPERNLPFSSHADDRPIWEREDLARVVERRPTGLLDWLTWHCRRIRLRPAERNGRVVIDGVLIMKGDQLPPDVYEAEFEQMVGYRIVAEAKPNQSPYPPIGLQRDRVVWRDSAALLQSAQPAGEERGQRRPKTFDAIGNRELHEDRDATNVLPIDLFGINLDQFNVLFWRHERLPVPPAYLRDAILYDGLQDALRLAEESGRSLNAATRRLAEMLLARDDERRPDPKAASALADSMAVGRRYWPRLGDHFTRFLEDQTRVGEAALRSWADEVRAAARTAFGEIAGGQVGGWPLRARVKAEHTLNVGLKVARTRHLGDLPVEDTKEEMHAIP